MVEIISDSKKLEQLKDDYAESKTIIKQLNNKINGLVDEIENAGCKVNHAMGLDFTVENCLAELYKEKIRELILLIQKKGYFPSVVKELKELLEKGEN